METIKKLYKQLINFTWFLAGKYFKAMGWLYKRKCVTKFINWSLNGGYIRIAISFFVTLIIAFYPLFILSNFLVSIIWNNLHYSIATIISIIMIITLPLATIYKERVDKW